MKKRLVLGLLLVAMVCALFTVTSLAADAHDHTSHEGWTALDQAALEAKLSGGNYVLTTGKYYLTEGLDVSALAEWSSINVPKDNTVTLCLNGHCINASGTTGKRIRGILNYGVLNLMDCTDATVKGYVDSLGLWKKLADGEEVPTGCTAADLIGGVIYNGYTQNGGSIYNGGTLNMYSGNLAGSRSTSSSGGTAYGAGLYSASGSATNIYGGTIAYNVADGAGTSRGAVYAHGTFNMYGGTVRNNTAVSGGAGIYIAGGTFNMSGGTVTAHTTAKSGGGVYQVGGTFNMTGGTISNNNVTAASMYGGGVYVSAGTFNLKDGIITGNKSRGGSGVYVGSSATVNMYGGKVTGNTDGFGAGYEVCGKFNMYGGEITNNAGTSAGAISIWDGTVHIYGGTITGNTNNNNSASFTSTTGSAKKGTMVVNGNPVIHGSIYKASGYTVSILGGTFLNQSGTASYSVASHLATGAVQDANGKVTLPDAAARVYNGAVEVASYTDLKAAITEFAGTGYTVKMFKDFEDTTTSGTTYSVSVNNYIILDLNGHTVSIPNGYGFVVRGGTGVTKVFSSAAEKGVMKTKALAVYVSMGGIHLENLEIICPGAQAVGMEDITGNYNGKNIIKNCVLYNENWHTFSFNKNNGDSMAKAMLIVENTDIIAAGDGSTNHVKGEPIGMQAKAQSAQLKLGEGVRLFSKGTTPVGTKIVRVDGSKQEVKSDFTGHTYTVDGKEVTGLNLWTVPTEVATAAELTAAVADARVDTIVLTENITDTDAKITLGKRTLELKGNTLTVNALIADSGELKDSTSLNGKLVVGTTEGKANATFRDGNKQLVFGDANGFWLSEVKDQIKFEQKDDNTATYAFNIYLKNPNAEAYAKAHPETVTVGVTVAYRDSSDVRHSKAFTLGRTVNGIEGDPITYLLNNPTHGVKVHMSGFAGISAIWSNNWILTNTTSQMGGYAQINPVS